MTYDITGLGRPDNRGLRESQKVRLSVLEMKAPGDLTEAEHGELRALERSATGVDAERVRRVRQPVLAVWDPTGGAPLRQQQRFANPAGTWRRGEELAQQMFAHRQK